ncbi:MAG TPA: hypothetical protein VFQ25_01035 [Ktedonobacterales bacterium]|nr:hypothetical protein [Ktedonobacterales bacterium]
MGNGQHRNRRGARPRPGPHKHGGAGNAGRAAMRLIPPITPAIAAVDGVAAAPVTDEEEGEQSSELASAPPATPGALVAGLSMEMNQDTPASGQEEARQERRQRHNGGHAPQSTLEQAEPPEAESPEAGAARTPTPEDGAPRSGRNRFDRFYTPGQGARVERVERVAPPINPTLPPVISAPSAPTRRAERAPSASNSVDEDDDPDYTGPRGDVRGSVGGLIDSLHEVFARDRAVATQGGAARCGVCYLHFPVGELLYRDAEGFYVCESCAHALGSAHVPMVRRQQRQ